MGYRGWRCYRRYPGLADEAGTIGIEEDQRAVWGCMRIVGHPGELVGRC